LLKKVKAQFDLKDFRVSCVQIIWYFTNFN